MSLPSMLRTKPSITPDDLNAAFRPIFDALAGRVTARNFSPTMVVPDAMRSERHAVVALQAKITSTTGMVSRWITDPENAGGTETSLGAAAGGLVPFHLTVVRQNVDSYVGRVIFDDYTAKKEWLIDVADPVAQVMVDTPLAVDASVPLVSSVTPGRFLITFDRLTPQTLTNVVATVWCKAPHVR